MILSGINIKRVDSRLKIAGMTVPNQHGNSQVCVVQGYKL
jgi:hypothetical protein